MYGPIRAEPAKAVIAERQREAERAQLVRQARAVRAAQRGKRAATMPGAVVARRIRTLLRARTVG